MTPITATSQLQSAYPSTTVRRNEAADQQGGAAARAGETRAAEAAVASSAQPRQNADTNRVADELNRQLTASKTQSLTQAPTQPSPAVKTDTRQAVATPGSPENLQNRTDNQAQTDRAQAARQNTQASQQREARQTREADTASRRAEEAQRPARTPPASQASLQAVAQYQSAQTSVLPESTTTPANRISATA
ncbi:hypothetical protein [Paludibacterium paludis]|uniref:Uncharacterized protein n=1 Tax=Paludibacterium paludis TaxID=1225769 RepID=A0A918UBM0_9NEIS|nr:hypothetical protein [Paludibacterium paludis]GGY23160.1 hypothetical protein GCM10011289_28660 [Paludibacterium paludis]